MTSCELAHRPTSARRRESASLQDTPSASDTACPLTVTPHDSGAVGGNLVGEADISTQMILENALSQALSMNRNAVVLDVSGPTFCDSTCVSAVLNANREGSRLVLASHSGIVNRAFQLLDPGQTITRHE